MSDPQTFDRRDLRSFRLEAPDNAEARIVFSDGTSRPASLVEYVLWNECARLEREALPKLPRAFDIMDAGGGGKIGETEVP